MTFVTERVTWPCVAAEWEKRRHWTGSTVEPVAAWPRCSLAAAASPHRLGSGGRGNFHACVRACGDQERAQQRD